MTFRMPYSDLMWFRLALAFAWIVAVSVVFVAVMEHMRKRTYPRAIGVTATMIAVGMTGCLILLP